jgi:hypothetical protein
VGMGGRQRSKGNSVDGESREKLCRYEGNEDKYICWESRSFYMRSPAQATSLASLFCGSETLSSTKKDLLVRVPRQSARKTKSKMQLSCQAEPHTSHALGSLG